MLLRSMGVVEGRRVLVQLGHRNRLVMFLFRVIGRMLCDWFRGICSFCHKEGGKSRWFLPAAPSMDWGNRL